MLILLLLFKKINGKNGVNGVDLGGTPCTSSRRLVEGLVASSIVTHINAFFKHILFIPSRVARNPIFLCKSNSAVTHIIIILCYGFRAFYFHFCVIFMVWSNNTVCTPRHSLLLCRTVASPHTTGQSTTTGRHIFHAIEIEVKSRQPKYVYGHAPWQRCIHQKTLWAARTM